MIIKNRRMLVASGRSVSTLYMIVISKFTVKGVVLMFHHNLYEEVTEQPSLIKKAHHVSYLFTENGVTQTVPFIFS